MRLAHCTHIVCYSYHTLGKHDAHGTLRNLYCVCCIHFVGAHIICAVHIVCAAPIACAMSIVCCSRSHILYTMSAKYTRHHVACKSMLDCEQRTLHVAHTKCAQHSSSCTPACHLPSLACCTVRTALTECAQHAHCLRHVTCSIFHTVNHLNQN